MPDEFKPVFEERPDGLTEVTLMLHSSQTQRICEGFAFPAMEAATEDTGLHPMAVVGGFGAAMGMQMAHFGVLLDPKKLRELFPSLTPMADAYEVNFKPPQDD